MRYPVDNYKTEWNGTAGYGFGAKTSYGFHDGVDINDNLGGNSDLGKPLLQLPRERLLVCINTQQQIHSENTFTSKLLVPGVHGTFTMPTATNSLSW